MPYTPAQTRLFHAATHDPLIAKRHGMSMGKARQMTSEGVKPAVSKRQHLAKLLRK